jgi:DNA anti-recombination protein RmuC
MMKFAAVAVLVAGMAFAQTPSPAPRAKVRQRALQALNLTAAQKQQAKTIFQQTRLTAQPLAQELKQNHQALQAAVKAGNDSETQQLATVRGHILGQVAAIRAQALAKFYGNLTPDQRARADEMHLRIQQIVKKRLEQRGNG